MNSTADNGGRPSSTAVAAAGHTPSEPRNHEGQPPRRPPAGHLLPPLTVVPGLAGAVLKESPSDFVVVEIPQNAGSKFTPADPDEPVPKEARKPVVHKIPPVDTVMAAIKEWRERQLTGAAYQGPEVIPRDEAEQMPWNLAKGFDVVTEQLGAPATAQFQDWLLQVATRVAFDAKEEEEEEEKRDGVGGPIDVLLPPPEPPRQVVLECPPSLDKAGRTEVHGTFRNHMAYFSTTAIMPAARPKMAGGGDEFGAPPPMVPNDGKVYLEVSFEKRKSRASWPKGRGEYLEFSVYKAGRSTSEVAEALCQRLYIKRARLSYAGAKDRRALTAQKMRCWRLPAEAIHEAHADGLLSQDGLAVSDYRYVETDLSLGGLKGNHFDVLLRPPSGGWGRGEAAREGFVNFFGEQRFGRDGTNNLDVGLLLLEGDWPAAIDRIMAPHPADSAMVSEAKEAFFDGRDYGYSMRGAPAGGGRRGRGGNRDGREQEGGGRRGGGQEEVVRVTAEAARAGVFTIKHVVLPLPGNSVMFPLNPVGEEMLVSLKQDGVDDVILNGHPQKAFDLEGAYRHVMNHQTYDRSIAAFFR
ncbi:pseudouridine synthase [Ectocarpus siliculosus]|uniref:Pseudouridine synthase n=1 Tax=Ectocarpus siliculosus TaxID=2880 RepID=D7FYR3_ECTSI|nr:pseudouridine synthase [Ectocarpus siliculosus]|eukprot:CBJ32590.1 pseudouridine synthase [Ectocarpus siliculosus]